jgi:23S rRNA (guanosine2251-2'-O)-methyltransferase
LLLSVREKPQSLVLALDQIQDPQNLGAIMRSAECCGVDGVLIPEDRSTHVTPTVCKAAAGAVEYLNISLVTNLARCLRDLKEVGFWVVGTTLETDSPIKVEDALDFKWPEKVVLILGSEGKGMRRLTQESCDFLLHLPLTGKITSLNVAAAAAVFLYEIIRSRRNSRK